MLKKVITTRNQQRFLTICLPLHNFNFYAGSYFFVILLLLPWEARISALKIQTQKTEMIFIAIVLTLLAKVFFIKFMFNEQKQL